MSRSTDPRYWVHNELPEQDIDAPTLFDDVPVVFGGGVSAVDRCRTDDVFGHDKPMFLVKGAFYCEFCARVILGKTKAELAEMVS